MAQGKLEKITIIAYNNPHCEKSQQVGEPYSALINPESYVLDYKIEFTEAQGHGTSAATQRFNL